MAEVALLSSKTVIREPAKKRPNIVSLPSNIGAMVGVTERGPIGVATKCTSYEEWLKNFGRKIANSDCSVAAQGFFDGGGSELHQARVVHYTNPAIPATQTALRATLTLLTAVSAPTAGAVLGSINSPFNLEPGDTLSIAVDGGAPSVATFLATAASRTSGATQPFVLTNGMILTLSVDGGPVQSVTFLTAEFVSIGAATAAEVAAVINAKATGVQATVSVGAVVITSDKRGTASGINITGGTANAILTFTTGNIAGTGNVANVDAVTAAEVATVVNAAVVGQTTTVSSNRVLITSNTTGPASSILVQAVSTADDELGLDNATHSGSSGAAVNTLQIDGKTEGTYAHRLTIRTSAPSSGASDEFDLIVLDNGVITEVFANLNMISTSTKYVETKINAVEGSGSDLIEVTDLLAPLTSPNNRPAFGTFGPLAGGNDGLVGLVDADFLGDAEGLTGVHAFDRVEGLRLLAVPGRASSSIHNGMITYCESVKKLSMWPILDPPANTTATGIVTYVKITTALFELSEHGGMFWPRIKIANPDKVEFGNTDLITIPPSGHIMGAYARQASLPGGVYQAAAGVELGLLTGALGLETDEVLDEAKRDLIYPSLINPIVSKNNVKPFIDGVRTLKTTGNFPTIGERLGAISIEQSIREDLEFARHKNNTPALRAEINRRITEYLLGQLRLNAFASTNPDDAFFVDTSDALNPPSVQKQLILKVRIGLAFASPAEFLILEFVQDTRALDAELAA